MSTLTGFQIVFLTTKIRSSQRTEGNVSSSLCKKFNSKTIKCNKDIPVSVGVGRTEGSK